MSSTLKLYSFIFVILFSTLSCEKKSTEVIQEKPLMENPIDSTLSVIDTASVIIPLGFENHVDIHQVLDLSPSSKVVDSLDYVVHIAGKSVLKLHVVKDTITMEGSFQTHKGLYFSELDSNLMVGRALYQGYAYKLGDTLNYSTLRVDHYDTSNFFNQSRLEHLNKPKPLSYEFVKTDGGGLYLHRWTASSDPSNPDYQEGYLGFRFLQGNEIKYGCLQIDVENRQKIVIKNLYFQD